MNRFARVVLFASLAISGLILTPGQSAQAGLVQHHHYALIDMGTFGGSLSAVNEPLDFVPAVNGQGQTVGYSANKVPQTATSNPTACFPIPNVSQGFEWNGSAVKKLGSLAGPGFCSDADSINDYGVVEGLSEINVVDPATGFNEVRATVWRNGQITNLGTLGGNSSWGFGINDSGQVIGMALNAIPDPYSLYDFTIFGSGLGTETRAFLWQNGKMQDLGTLGGPDAWAFFINQFDQIAGLSYTNSTPNPSTGFPTLDPFLWTGGKMQDLGTLGGVVGFAAGVNNLGEVVGGSSVAANPGACFSPGGIEFNNPGCDPFLWNRGKLIDLATSTTGGVPFDVRAINDLGEIVGGANFPADFPNTFQGYLWIGGTAIDLGHVTGDCFSEAWAINLRSQVVGDSLACPDGSPDNAFLWEDGSIVNLNSLIPASSSLHLARAWAINPEGEIAGKGVPPGVSPADVDSLGHAFLLIPCDENHLGVKGCDYSAMENQAQSAPINATIKDEGVAVKQSAETRASSSRRSKRREPDVTGVFPGTGRVGTQVQILGKNLNWIDYVTFNGLYATFSIDSTLQLTATVPNIQGNAQVVVTSRYGRASTDFTFIPGPPGCWDRGHPCSQNPQLGQETCCQSAHLVCVHYFVGLPGIGSNFCNY